MSSSKSANNSNMSKMNGGSVAPAPSNSNNEAFYLYKARKYHEKIRMKLQEMERRGLKCPDGYEQYKVPFDQRTY